MSVLQQNEYFKNKEEEVLVYGDNGLRVKARSENQAKMVKESEKNDMIFAIGPAGSGKTYTAVALAVRALKAKVVRRIILTRPAVEAGENLGFPGWKAFGDSGNRFGLLNDYMDGAMEGMREFNYIYHRKGLDRMSEAPDSARAAIATP